MCDARGFDLVAVDPSTTRVLTGDLGIRDDPVLIDPGGAMPHVDLSSHPVVPTEFGRWQRLNEPLGMAAFGVNAIVCDPGEVFDIEHDETEGGQQELYVVVAGRAEFRIGDEVTQAGPGTVVSAPDPAAVRRYRALEPGTRIVCMGGVPVEQPDFGEWIADAAGGEA
ncbi:MAG: hypothetical protein ACXVYV_00635 [Gaiellales bacterium]